MANRLVLPFADVGSGIVPADGAQLFFFETGGAKKKTTFSDREANTPNPNPVVANQNGRFPAIFIEGEYKVVLQDKKNNQIWEEDPVSELSTVSSLLSKRYTSNFSTVAEVVASTDFDRIFEDGSNSAVLRIDDRDSGLFDVVLSDAVTPNTFNVVQLVGLPTLAIVLRIDSTVNAKEFGAAGDGTTDDSLAVQAAIDFAAALTQSERRYLFFPTGVYIFNSGLIIPNSSSHVTLQGVSSGGIGATALHFIHPLNASIPIFIDSKIQNFSLYDIRIEQIADDDYTTLDPVTAIQCRRETTDTADTDTIINRVSVKQFAVGLEHWGRGLNFDDNVFVESGICVDLYWPNVGDYVPSLSAISLDTTGYRAFRITNNRFHSIGTIAVRNSATNAEKIHAMQIKGNMLDIGRRLFEGVLVDSSIVDNVSTLTPVKVLVIQDGSKNYIVSNLVAAGNTDASRIPDFFIELTGTHTNAMFSDINLDNCTNDAIRGAAGSVLNGVSFNDITVGFISDSTRSCLNLLGTNTDVYVNNLAYNGSLLLDEAVSAVAGNIIHVDGYRSVTATPLSITRCDSNQTVIIDEATGEFFKLVGRTGTVLGTISFKTAGVSSIAIGDGEVLIVDAIESLRPITDNVATCGSATNRWSEVFAGNATINTSDEREKTKLKSLTNKEKKVSADLKTAIKSFRFKDAIKIKGEPRARIHFGVGAQTVKEIFESHGLDPHDYSLFCYNEWDDESGSGNRYGIRYEELLCFMISTI